jgi:hypothetical protein
VRPAPQIASSGPDAMSAGASGRAADESKRAPSGAFYSPVDVRLVALALAGCAGRHRNGD